MLCDYVSYYWCIVLCALSHAENREVILSNYININKIL
nr:MAG TPA: protein of unknown function (DUF4436) [Caudoviricetes sp.]